MAVLLTVMPMPKFIAFDDNGDPLNGGFLYTFAAGTSTPLATYADSGQTTPNTNPVELDSAGRATVFLQAATYKFRLEDSEGNILWTVDGVSSTGLSQSIVGVGGLAWDFGGEFNSPITQTSYTSGATAAALHAGTSILNIDSGLLTGTFGISATIQSLSSITTTVAICNLSDGSPDTPIQTVTSTSAAGATVTSAAIPFATAGVAKNYGIKVKVSSGTGFSWGCQLVRLS